MQLQKNQLFHNRYVLIELMGSGASAEVWKAQDTKAGNLIVALKIYSSIGGNNMDSVGLSNFQQEFTTVYNMTHTNLLRPSGYDVCSGCPYLVMQFCENGSANSMVGRINESDLLHFLHDVSKHAQNIEFFAVTGFIARFKRIMNHLIIFKLFFFRKKFFFFVKD